MEIKICIISQNNEMQPIKSGVNFPLIVLVIPE
jgi:hypothetical protein